MRANYRNYARSIEPELEHLEKFFRNLLLGETNELKNCYLIISTPEELTLQVPRKLIPADTFCQKLVLAIGNNSCSVKTMMEQLKLSDRKNFLNNYLNPAIKDGFVRLLYPESPRHLRQKYLLTVKGLAAYQKLQH